MAEGHSAGQIILQLHDCIVPSDTLNDRQKSAICERVAVSGLHMAYNFVSRMTVPLINEYQLGIP